MNHQHANSILDSYESTENALMDSFKAAALKVTNLYKDSLVQNRKAFAAGYQQALQDLYEFISSHPGTTIQGGGSLSSTPIERGILPVEDLLMYARQKNAQLATEMGFPTEGHVPHPQQQPMNDVPANQPSSMSNQTPITNSSQKNENATYNNMDVQANHDTQPMLSSTHGTSHSQSLHHNATSAPAPTAAAAVKNAFYPFQIDPNTQFTFTVPHDAPHWRSSFPLQPNTNSWSPDMYTQDDDNDHSKRRYAPSELTFMGRSLNNMNIDTWAEPPFKRGRSKRDT
ncbi:uncharacterized protein BYT42DRAFT_564311 [Radiomyces spectabilis]|uniref:uncharacterized protein n=1 Tax=Radiomyces spectabilis TaxID=64574 RepID=UPI00221FF179|nr:uncharacterized protein BYT42DRAFT_564311 [Radiomyces spectabilis]KAI8384992.1 hypothetical protein BYT42DRAFT_564311 [Radiomyces spectabilis]